MKINQYGFAQRTASKQRRAFKIERSLYALADLMGELPTKDESFRAVSYEGGFASISFIVFVAFKEKIEELTVATLHIGEKQFCALQEMHKRGRLGRCKFVIGSLMRSDSKREAKYDYYSKFKVVCAENGWEYVTVNNHAKVILMRTTKNYYVLETSSNLNENPKIEQFTLENDEQLYNFYKAILDELFTAGGEVQ